MGIEKSAVEFAEEMTEPSGWPDVDETLLYGRAADLLNARNELHAVATNWREQRARLSGVDIWSGGAASAAGDAMSRHINDMETIESRLAKAYAFYQLAASIIEQTKFGVNQNLQNAQAMIHEIKGLPDVSEGTKASLIELYVAWQNIVNSGKVSAGASQIPDFVSWTPEPSQIPALVQPPGEKSASALSRLSFARQTNSGSMARSPMAVNNSRPPAEFSDQGGAPVHISPQGPLSPEVPARSTVPSEMANSPAIASSPTSPAGSGSAMASSPTSGPTSSASSSASSSSAASQAGASASAGTAPGGGANAPGAKTPAGSADTAKASRVASPVQPISSQSSTPLATSAPATTPPASSPTSQSASAVPSPGGASSGAGGGASGAAPSGTAPVGAAPVGGTSAPPPPVPLGPPTSPAPPAPPAGGPGTAVAAAGPGIAPMSAASASGAAAAPAPVPVSAARAERDAIAAASTPGARRKTGEGDPLQRARHIAGALNVGVMDFGFFWVTGVTADGVIVVANSYGLAYIPDRVNLPDHVKMATADETIPANERATWATYPILAVQGWCRHHDKQLRAVVATEEQFANFDPGVAKIVLTADDIPDDGTMNGRSRLEVIAPEAAQRLVAVGDTGLTELLPPAGTDDHPPADQTAKLWFEVAKPLMSTSPQRAAAHLQAFIAYANHAQELALHRAHTASNPDAQRQAITDWIYWQHLEVLTGDALGANA